MCWCIQVRESSGASVMNASCTCACSRSDRLWGWKRFNWIRNWVCFKHVRASLMTGMNVVMQKQGTGARYIRAGTIGAELTNCWARPCSARGALHAADELSPRLAMEPAASCSSSVCLSSRQTALQSHSQAALHERLPCASIDRTSSSFCAAAACRLPRRALSRYSHSTHA